MSRWIEVAKVDECPPGTAIERVAGDRIVALYHMGDTFYALDGVCPHQGGPLGKGELSGCIVTCPWHGWQFDVTDGRHQISPNIRQPAFEVRQEGDSVLVRIEENP